METIFVQKKSKNIYFKNYETLNIGRYILTNSKNNSFSAQETNRTFYRNTYGSSPVFFL